MKWEMEVLSPSSYLSSTNWFGEESKSWKWTSTENKMFENALAVYDKDTPDLWQKVVAMIPGKTVEDVMKQYRELKADVSSIEAGLVSIPGYSTSPFTLDWVNSHGFDGLKHSYGLGGKDLHHRAGLQIIRGKKGFLGQKRSIRLKTYGKGDWRNISLNFVVTRTSTQVASHAQKYFIRQLSGEKDKRRASIHGITTVNLNHMRTPSLENKGTPLPEQSSMLPQQPNSAATGRTHFQWNPPCGGATTAFNSTQGSMLMS